MVALVEGLVGNLNPNGPHRTRLLTLKVVHATHGRMRIDEKISTQITCGQHPQMLAISCAPRKKAATTSKNCGITAGTGVLFSKTDAFPLAVEIVPNPYVCKGRQA